MGLWMLWYRLNTFGTTVISNDMYFSHVAPAFWSVRKHDNERCWHVRRKHSTPSKSARAGHMKGRERRSLDQERNQNGIQTGRNEKKKRNREQRIGRIFHISTVPSVMDMCAFRS